MREALIKLDRSPSIGCDFSPFTFHRLYTDIDVE